MFIKELRNQAYYIWYAGIFLAFLHRVKDGVNNLPLYFSYFILNNGVVSLNSPKIYC